MDPLRQPTHVRFAITEEADIGALRRRLRQFAVRLGVDQRLAQAELVATELATNLLRHAKPGGWILARPLPPSSIELIAVDRGPGLPDGEHHPGGSARLGTRHAPRTRTGWPGELGAGLDVIRRGASHFDLHTGPGAGTVVLAAVDLSEPDHPERSISPGRRGWAGVSVGLGEACGDGWAVVELRDGLAVAVVDGLGHGPLASEAADAALRAFAAAPDDLDRFVLRAHQAMLPTRGGVVAVCRLYPHRDELQYRVVGNISGRVVAPHQTRSLPAPPGTLGTQATPPRATTGCLPWPAGAVLLLWSDGLRSGIEPPDPALLHHDPAVLAALLHRDYTREHDDATIVAVRRLDTP